MTDVKCDVYMCITIVNIVFLFIWNISEMLKSCHNLDIPGWYIRHFKQ